MGVLLQVFSGCRPTKRFLCRSTEMLRFPGGGIISPAKRAIFDAQDLPRSGCRRKWQFTAGESFDGNRVVVNQWIFNPTGMQGRPLVFAWLLRDGKRSERQISIE